MFEKQLADWKRNPDRFVYASATGVMVQVYMLTPEVITGTGNSNLLDRQMDPDSIKLAKDDKIKVDPTQDG